MIKCAQNLLLKISTTNLGQQTPLAGFQLELAVKTHYGILCDHLTFACETVTNFYPLCAIDGTHGIESLAQRVRIDNYSFPE